MGAAAVTTDVTPELAEAIQRGYDQRDRANMAPTIAYFQALLAEHPDHPVLVYEVGGAYDTAGQEETARGYDGDVLAVLDRARREFPDSDSVRVFRALTLNDAQRPDEAVAELLTVVTGHAEVTDLGRWAVGLRGLAQWLADGRPE